MQKAGEQPLVTRDDAARRLCISTRSLYELTVPRGPIRSVRVGGAVRYSIEEIERYIAAATDKALASDVSEASREA